MLICEWDVQTGWNTPIIKPYGPISLDPSCSVFHYALECFEGMKAYLDEDKNVRLFRPMMNVNRLKTCGNRVGLPDFDSVEFLELIKKLVNIDKDWIPEGFGFSLYIRPTFISTQATVGVTFPTKAMLFVILSPVGPYYPTGFKPVSLLCSDGKYCRAWPGGSGNTKVGGNYALTILPGREASEKGHSQVLWLFNDFCTEVGTMNFFVLWINEKGEKELITAPLDGCILPGVTRDSILALAKTFGDVTVSEKPYTMTEVVKAIESDRIIEVFGAGTAAVVSPVNKISYKGNDYIIPLDKANPDAEIGLFTKKCYDSLMDIQYGKIEHEWSMVIGEKN
jgi:branched-chain amino acid aminotransferase